MAHARRALSKGFVGLGVLLLGVAISTGAQATTISVSLPALTGPLPHPGEGQGIVQLPGSRGPGDPGYGGRPIAPVTQLDRSASFDLQTTFSSISEVSLHLVGHTECPEGGCSPAAQLEAFVTGPVLPGTRPLPSPAVLSGPLSGAFELDLSLPALQGLENGKGGVLLSLANALPYRPPFTVPADPVLVITSARLTLIGDALRDGSLPPQTVPEPSMLALAGTALGMVGALRRKAS